MIEAHELTKRYGDTTAVHSLRACWRTSQAAC